jgi:hypothetical protein
MLRRLRFIRMKSSQYIRQKHQLYIGDDLSCVSISPNLQTNDAQNYVSSVFIVTVFAFRIFTCVE